MNYKEILNSLYKDSVEHDCCPPDNKYQFLGSTIFDFTTYDSEMDELFAKNMLEVIECILNRKTFEYQAISKEKYVNYLTMVNMPFLNEILEWGGSIRGAWFNDYCSPVLFCDVTIPKQELTIFFKELLEWANDVIF